MQSVASIYRGPTMCLLFFILWAKLFSSQPFYELNIITFLFTDEENWGSRRLSNLPKLMQFVKKQRRYLKPVLSEIKALILSFEHIKLLQWDARK